ncbi:hypothetical protein [Alkalinema sp. FACHB-956]|uniref:hypothetical protein n=1 Tax=Alkalinema sp. FACHB-956 TaxID=2692768 RepID=UPI00168545E2|nr:hypothetical protein [Alkalinema sp. FACHB-956]MBD2326339.1 hypothetical protein [Alkalinema sp. FACHB-956]
MALDRPYQSQFLNFFSRQTQKLKDRAGVLWRNFKLAAIWGAQLSLYPIYAVFQASRLVGKQLNAGVRQAALWLTAGADQSDEPVATDAAIQKVISALTQNTIAPAPVGQVDPLLALLTEGTEIRGVASLVSTQRMVLVSTDNQVLDVLTQTQQQQLKRRIIFELALYYRYWRRHQLKTGGALVVHDRSTMAIPLRLFWQLMAWIQSSPIAVSANLFQEAKLTGSNPPLLQGFQPNLRPSTASSALAMGSSGRPERLANPLRWNTIGAALRAKIDTLGHGLPQLREVPDLIQAAIRYFFGPRATAQAAKTLYPSATTVASLPGQAKSFTVVEDPWLTSQDLFGAGAPSMAGTSASSTWLDRWLVPAEDVPTTLFGVVTTALPGQPQPTLGGTLKQWIQSTLADPLSALTQSAANPATPKAGQQRTKAIVLNRRGALRTKIFASLTVDAISTPEAASNSTRALIGVDLDNWAISSTRTEQDTVTNDAETLTGTDAIVEADTTTTQPDKFAAAWLEAEATPLGYEQTWWEKVLDWCDRILVWVEQGILTLWRWFKSRR